VVAHWSRSVKLLYAGFVSDIAIFVLKRDVKLQLTNSTQGLVLGWVSGDRMRAGKPPRFVTSHSGQLSLLPSPGKKMNTGDDTLWLGSVKATCRPMVRSTCG